MKKIADAYAPFFVGHWKRVGNVFRRRVGQGWVQSVSFNTSRFSDDYIPRACFEFLKTPGPALCGYLTHELLTGKGVQRWVSPPEHQRGVTQIVAEMAGQFRPRIDREISEADVRKELEAKRTYWPHLYALAVLAAEEGNRAGALSKLGELKALNERKKSPYIDEAAARVEELMRMGDAPGALRAELEKRTREKLVELRLSE